MIIEIEANDFCPDNCPFFESRDTMLYEFGEGYKKLRHCNHSAICDFAVDQYKEQLRRELGSEVDNDKS